MWESGMDLLPRQKKKKSEKEMKVSEKRGRGRGREVKSRSERGKKAISAVFPRPLCWSFPELVVPSRFTPPHKKRWWKRTVEKKRNQKKGKCRGWRGATEGVCSNFSHIRCVEEFRRREALKKSPPPSFCTSLSKEKKQPLFPTYPLHFLFAVRDRAPEKMKKGRILFVLLPIPVPPYSYDH